MKNLRIVLTIAAFSFAIAVAAMTTKSKNLESGAFGYDPYTSQCVEGDLLQEGCSANGMYACTIWIVDIEEEVQGYQWQHSTNSCAVVFKRWQY